MVNTYNTVFDATKFIFDANMPLTDFNYYLNFFKSFVPNCSLIFHMMNFFAVCKKK